MIRVIIKTREGGETLKKMCINIKVLKSFMKEKKWGYKELANETGLSVTQAFHLVQSKSRVTKGGAVTLGCLATLNIPGLFFLEHSSHLQTIRIPIEMRVMNPSNPNPPAA